MRIDGKVLSSGQADVTAGEHKAGWDVVSPTVRPIVFGVTIVKSVERQRRCDEAARVSKRFRHRGPAPRLLRRPQNPSRQVLPSIFRLGNFDEYRRDPRSEEPKVTGSRRASARPNHSASRGIGPGSQPVTAFRRPSLSAWQTGGSCLLSGCKRVSTSSTRSSINPFGTTKPSCIDTQDFSTRWRLKFRKGFERLHRQKGAS